MTDVQICNLALARLGDARITSLSDATAQAQYCSLFYAQTVEELQADFEWSFCRKQANLTNGTAPLTGYSVQYSLPADFIRVIRLGRIDDSENFGTWEIVGDKIHTNFTSPVALDYVANITDSTKFPAIFIEALTIKLAGLLAMPLTGSKELFGQMVELFMATVQKPAFLKATEAYAPARPTSTAMSVSEICKQAIMRLGDTDTLKGQPMVFANSFYDHTLEELVADVPWAFAKKQQMLNADPTIPGQGYAKRYALPADFVQLIRVEDIDTTENFGQWEIIGGYLHTDLGAPVVIDYTAAQTDVTKFPAPFIAALISRLAAKIAMPLTGNADIANAMATVAGETMQRPSVKILIEKSAKPRATSAANTVAEICRQAILRVGSAEVFKPFGEPMVIAQSLYEQTRNEVLSDFDWQFARNQASLTAAPTPPAFGYSTRYALPTGTLKVLRVNGVDEDENFGNWEIVGGFLHTNYSTPIKVETIQVVSDTSKYPPVFVNMLTVTLAFKLSQLIELQVATK
jgi:hypothetical protein